MNPKALIDLHCDTLTDCRPTPAGNPDTLDDPERVLSLVRHAGGCALGSVLCGLYSR